MSDSDSRRNDIDPTRPLKEIVVTAANSEDITAMVRGLAPIAID
jgi:hypothetical protein